MNADEIREQNVRRWVSEAGARSLALVLEQIGQELAFRRYPGADTVRLAAEQVRLCAVADRAALFALRITGQDCTTRPE